MKNIFIFTFLFLSTVVCCAQDLIVKNNGDEIRVKVLNVDENKVSYKKWTNKTGPTYSLGTDKIFMIKYKNGEKDVFSKNGKSNKSSVSATSTSNDEVTGYIEKEPAADNAELIKKYNPNVELNLKSTRSKSKYIFPILGMESSSIISNGDVEISFVRKAAKSEYGLLVLRTYIDIKNKTNRVIYIDKANSFKTFNNIATPFYDTKQISVSEGRGSGASVGLGSIAGALGVGGVVGDIAGGVSVGGGSSSSVSTTYSQQRILAIPPHTSAYLSEHKYDNYKGNKWKQISEAEDYVLYYNGERINKGCYKEYNADNSPYKYKYFIMYSTSPDFKTYSSVNANLYVKYIIGESTKLSKYNFWQSYPCCPFSYGTEEQINKCYNDIILNFKSVPSMIVGVLSYQ